MTVGKVAHWQGDVPPFVFILTSVQTNLMTFTLIGVQRTYADFFGKVKKVEVIGPYFAEDRYGNEQVDIVEITKRYDIRNHRNVDGFPVVKWESVEWVGR